MGTLEEWKQIQYERLKEFTNNLDDLQIFQNSPITITKDSIEKQYKKILQRDNTLKKIRIHDFRHGSVKLMHHFYHLSHRSLSDLEIRNPIILVQKLFFIAFNLLQTPLNSIFFHLFHKKIFSITVPINIIILVKHLIFLHYTII